MNPSCLLMGHGSPRFHLSLRCAGWREHTQTHAGVCRHQINCGWKRNLTQPGCNLRPILLQGYGCEAKFPDVPSAGAKRTWRRRYIIEILLFSSWVVEGISTLRTKEIIAHIGISFLHKTSGAQAFPELQPCRWDGDCDREQRAASTRGSG